MAGYSKLGNAGHGLGMKFARSLSENLGLVFEEFADEAVGGSDHMEKLCIIDSGIGRDNISDFTTNLIKAYLLRYTERFAKSHISSSQTRKFRVERVDFDYGIEAWSPAEFVLPVLDDDYVILTPRDILTLDDTWINRKDLVDDVSDIISSVPNDQLRAQLNNYLEKHLPQEDRSKEDLQSAVSALVRRFPVVLDYFVKLKEENGEKAIERSADNVQFTEQLFVEHASALAGLLRAKTPFYSVAGATFKEARDRALWLKDVVENRGGHRLFVTSGGPIKRERGHPDSLLLNMVRNTLRCVTSRHQ